MFRRLRYWIDRIAPGRRYAVYKELGRGGYAIVHQAYDKVGKEFVALKVLRQDKCEDFSRMLFEHEAHVLNALSHPSIVSAKSKLMMEGELPCFAMDMLRGETLAERVFSHGRLPWERLVKIVLEVCGALEFSRDQGIIHFDVTPKNILLGPTSGAVLFDFGISSSANFDPSDPLYGRILGTAQFMAPELFMGCKHSCKTEVFSLGMILYFGLTGKYPFDKDNQIELIDSLMSAQRPHALDRVKDVPAELDELVFNAMSADPRRRCQSAREMKDVLLAIL